jgi:glycosyltransferase involved in cell wall biosynthesis
MTSIKQKIAIIGTVGLPAKYGGFETLADHLVENLNEDYDLTVYCSAKKYAKEERPSKYKNARLVFLPLDANGIQSIPYDTWSIIHALFYADVLLILGVAGAWILPFVKFFTNKKIIISIDGIEWKRNKWSRPAKWYLWWAEKMAVKYSHIDISDNESIQDYTAVRYGTLSRIIEYGADHTMSVPVKTSLKTSYPFLGLPYAFKVCRIEPENNVDIVLSAFAKLPKHRLVIIGNWNNSDYGKNLKKLYSTFSHIFLLDPIYDQSVLDMIRGNAFLYIHGHSAGGTNPSLVEAMYLGLPIFSYGVTYNRTTTENKARYFYNEDELINLINKTQIAEVKSIGNTMKEIAYRRYTWKAIADKYRALIAEVLVSAPKSSITPTITLLPTEELLKRELYHLHFQKLFFEK